MSTPKRHLLATATLAVCGLFGTAAYAQSQEKYVGEIFCGGWNFAPTGSLLLQGQILQIAQYPALYALLGVRFGGDGQTTFALPDMRGRVLVGAGQAAGLSAYTVGQRGGNESVALTEANLPTHTHQVSPLGSTSVASSSHPAGHVPAVTPRSMQYAAPTNTVAMGTTTTSAVGSSIPVGVRQPYLAINCAIAVDGIFPTQD